MTKAPDIVIPVDANPRGLAIIREYEPAVNYLYPILINMSRKHRVLRDSLMEALFDQYRLFYEAAKSDQVSRIYMADAGLAYIRELLHFMADSKRRFISRNQCTTANVNLAKAGAMVYAWIERKQSRKR